MSSFARADDNVVPLDEILCTDELMRRPQRPPDHAAENRALSKLVRALADSPSTILQTLADTVLEVFGAHSAGLSLLAKDGQRFYWAAIAGAWEPHRGGGTPRDFGPCGDVLDRNTPLLFKRWELRYPYLREATPLAEEGLLVPFHVGGKAVGTIWMIAHDESRRFDAEDLRQLESLGRFAAAAYHTVELQHAENARRARAKTNERLRESEERYRTLFQLGPLAVYSVDASGTIQEFNHRAVELWGRTPKAGTDGDRYFGWHRLLTTDGKPLPVEEFPVPKVLRGEPGPLVAELVGERADGSRRTIVVNVCALHDRRGNITGAINCFYDITDRKQAELRQQLLIWELNHRVKNTLATVQSIAMHTLTAPSDIAHRETFDARLISLSRTHDVLARTSWEGASLRELLRLELDPYRSPRGAPFVLDGPDLDVRPKLAVALGLAFHELATNAAKYGALSVPTGRVSVRWDIDDALVPRRLRLTWIESGGPPVQRVVNKGFGMTVIERGLSLEVDGNVTLDFDPAGVRCIIEIPMFDRG